MTNSMYNYGCEYEEYCNMNIKNGLEYLLSKTQELLKELLSEHYYAMDVERIKVTNANIVNIVGNLAKLNNISDQHMD